MDEFNYDDYFEEPRQPPVPYEKSSDTSRAAADELTPEQRGKDMWVVYQLLRSSPRTTDEMVVLLDSQNQSVSPRVRDLVQAGLVERSGETRKTRRGRSANVWRIVEGVSFSVAYKTWQQGGKLHAAPSSWNRAVLTAARACKANPTPESWETLRTTVLADHVSNADEDDEPDPMAWGMCR